MKPLPVSRWISELQTSLADSRPGQCGLGGGVNGALIAVLAALLSGPSLPPTAAEEGGDPGEPWEILDDDGDGWSNGDEAYVYLTDPFDPSSYPGAPDPSGDMEYGTGGDGGDGDDGGSGTGGDPSDPGGDDPSGDPGDPSDPSGGDPSGDPGNGGGDPGDGSGSGEVWLIDLDGDGLDDQFGYWIGSYFGPISPMFLPGYVAPPPVPGNFVDPRWIGWPDGTYDSDWDGLSDFFETANFFEETVWVTESGIDEFGEEWTLTHETIQTWGLRSDLADSDGDGARDGMELLNLSPLMLAGGGRPRFDPLVNESARDDDGDGIPTIREYVILGTNPLSADTDEDGLSDFEEVAIRQTDPLDPADPPSSESGAGNSGSGAQGSGGGGASGGEGGSTGISPVTPVIRGAHQVATGRSPWRIDELTEERLEYAGGEVGWNGPSFDVVANETRPSELGWIKLGVEFSSTSGAPFPSAVEKQTQLLENAPWVPHPSQWDASFWWGNYAGLSASSNAWTSGEPDEEVFLASGANVRIRLSPLEAELRLPIPMVVVSRKANADGSEETLTGFAPGMLGGTSAIHLRPPLVAGESWEQEAVPVAVDVFPSGDPLGVSADEAKVELFALVSADLGEETTILDSSEMEWRIVTGSSPGTITQTTGANDGVFSAVLNTSRRAGDGYRVEARLKKLDLEYLDENGQAVRATVTYANPAAAGETALIEVIPGLARQAGVIEGNVQNLPADGRTTTPLVWQFLDAHGNAVDEGRPVMWDLTGPGAIFDLEETTDALGRVRGHLLAGTVAGHRQRLALLCDDYDHHAEILNQPLGMALSSSAASLGIVTPEVAVITASFSADIADGTPILWRCSAGTLIDADPVVTDNTARATLMANSGTVGTEIVAAWVAHSVAAAPVEFVSSAPASIEIAHPVLAGDATEPGTVDLPTLNSGPEAVPYRTSTVLTARAPQFAGQTISLTLGGGAATASRFDFEALTGAWVLDSLRSEPLDPGTAGLETVGGANALDLEPVNVATVPSSPSNTVAQSLRSSLRLFPRSLEPATILDKPGEYRLSVETGGFLRLEVATAAGPAVAVLPETLRSENWNPVVWSVAGGLVTLQSGRALATASLPGGASVTGSPLAVGGGFDGAVDDLSFASMSAGSAFGAGQGPVRFVGPDGADLGGDVTLALDGAGEATVVIESTGQTTGDGQTVDVSVALPDGQFGVVGELLKVYPKEDLARLRRLARYSIVGEPFDQAVETRFEALVARLKDPGVFPVFSLPGTSGGLIRDIIEGYFGQIDFLRQEGNPLAEHLEEELRRASAVTVWVPREMGDPNGEAFQSMQFQLSELFVAFLKHNGNEIFEGGWTSTAESPALMGPAGASFVFGTYLAGGEVYGMVDSRDDVREMLVIAKELQAPLANDTFLGELQDLLGSKGARHIIHILWKQNSPIQFAVTDSAKAKETLIAFSAAANFREFEESIANKINIGLYGSLRQDANLYNEVNPDLDRFAKQVCVGVGYAWEGYHLLAGIAALGLESGVNGEVTLRKMASQLLGTALSATMEHPESVQALKEMIPIYNIALYGDDALTEYENGQFFQAGQRIIAWQLAVVEGALIVLPAAKGGATIIEASAGLAQRTFCRVAQRSTAWSLGPAPRGLMIEQAWGHNLPNAFKTLDRFENGIATSIKSFDLDLPSFGKPNGVWNAGRKAIDAAIDFEGYTLQGVRITPQMIQKRAVRIAIPHAPSPAQASEFLRLQQYGIDNGISVIWEVF